MAYRMLACHMGGGGVSVQATCGGGVAASSESGVLAMVQGFGGAVFVTGHEDHGVGRLVVSESVLADNHADTGGAFYVLAGSVTISNGTMFRNNSADEGATIFVSITDVIYLLPGPAGHYIAGSVCTELWAPCPVSCRVMCTVDNTLAPAKAISDPVSCVRPPYWIQVCPWNEEVSWSAVGDHILGQTLETLRPGPLDVPVWPIPCAQGTLGAATENFAGQTSSLCAGACPAGRYCPTSATVEPSICLPGSFCPEGSVLPQLCPAGTFSNETQLSSAAECAPAQPGTASIPGATTPTPCPPGSVSTAERAHACTKCTTGFFQSAEGRTRPQSTV